MKNIISLLKTTFVLVFFCSQVMAGESDSLSLSGFVLFSALPVSALDETFISKEKSECRLEYVSSLKSFFKKEPEAKKGENNESYLLSLRRWRLERQICFIFGKEVSKEAESFVSKLPLSLEWEGMADGPLAEAEYAEKWISQRPESKILPFVHLFAAHRLRALSEISCLRGDKEKIDLFFQGFRKHIKSALSSGNKRIICLAKDMEDLPHVYLRCENKP